GDGADGGTCRPGSPGGGVASDRRPTRAARARGRPVKPCQDDLPGSARRYARVGCPAVQDDRRVVEDLESAAAPLQAYARCATDGLRRPRRTNERLTARRSFASLRRTVPSARAAA